jgi:hypothetical protein
MPSVSSKNCSLQVFQEHSAKRQYILSHSAFTVCPYTVHTRTLTAKGSHRTRYIKVLLEPKASTAYALFLLRMLPSHCYCVLTVEKVTPENELSRAREVVVGRGVLGARRRSKASIPTHIIATPACHNRHRRPCMPNNFQLWVDTNLSPEYHQSRAVK